MRSLSTAVAALVLGMVCAGCGSSKLNKTRGRVIQDGKAFVPEKGVSIRVTFVPIVASGGRAMDYYHADVDNSTGAFKASGPDHKGVPPGKYRVAVEILQNKKDILNGKFDADNSPFVFDIDSKTPELKIDLSNPPATETS